MTAALHMPSLLDVKHDWTVDDLASLPQDLRYELIDGRLILPSPTYFHQDLCVELSLMLRRGCPPDHKPITDLSLQVDWRNEPRPDVVVARKAYAMRTPVPVDGALLVVEVISPTSRFRDLQQKLKLYAAHGVVSYLIVDPTFEGGVMLTENRLGEDGYYDAVVSTNKVFTTDVPYPITIDVPALTALRDEYRRVQDDT
ncbi:Uma2 family endonuclease [Actinoplanes sp. CA-054009]